MCHHKVTAAFVGDMQYSECNDNLRFPKICISFKNHMVKDTLTFSLCQFFLRFHDHWRFVMQRLAYLTAMKVYLTQDRLITLQETANLLGGINLLFLLLVI